MNNSRDQVKAIKLIQYIDFEFKNLYNLIDHLMSIPNLLNEQYDSFMMDAINFNHLIFFYHQFYSNLFDEELNHMILTSYNRVRELDNISRILFTKVIST